MRLSSLGDVLHGLPVLSSLRALRPDLEIGWAVEDRFEDLLSRRSDLAHLHVLPRRALVTGLSGLRWGRVGHDLRAFTRGLRAVGYDAVLDLQGNLKSGWVSLASRAPIRLGYTRKVAKEGNQRFQTRRWCPPQGPQHRVDRYLGLAGHLLGRRLPYVAPGFPLREEERTHAQRLLEEAGLTAGAGLCLIHPGTSAFGAFKRWPAERYAALVRRLAGEGHAIGITVGPGEHALGVGIVAASEGTARLLEPASLGVLAALVASAGRFLSADTGPLHLASLLGTPLLGLFGPKDPRIYGPHGLLPAGGVGPLPTLVRDDVACRPCRLRRCADPLCMTRLDVESVHQALLQTGPQGT